MAEFASLGELEVFTKGLKEHITNSIGALTIEMRGNFDEVKNKQNIANGRLKKLELWRAYIVGALAVLNTMVYPVVLIYLQNHIK